MKVIWDRESNKFRHILDVKCPYCGEAQDIDHEEGYGYEEDEEHEQYCNNCEKAFLFMTIISYDYEVSKKDGDWEWQ